MGFDWWLFFYLIMSTILVWETRHNWIMIGCDYVLGNIRLFQWIIILRFKNMSVYEIRLLPNNLSQCAILYSCSLAQNWSYTNNNLWIVEHQLICLSRGSHMISCLRLKTLLIWYSWYRIDFSRFILFWSTLDQILQFDLLWPFQNFHHSW